MGEDPSVHVRQARAADHDAVVAFTENTWPDREERDYLPRVFTEWVETDGDDQHTFVATVDGDDGIAGVCQGLLVSDREAWAQGMRVNPQYRGEGVAHRLNEALFDWAAGRGATVCRNLVFSWNASGLATSRAVGFEPVAEFRWAQPDPELTAATESGYTTDERPGVAWNAWRDSDARAAMDGLGLSLGETWVLQELTREHLERAADEHYVVTVRDGDELLGTTYRATVTEREESDEQIAVYGATAWTDPGAAEAVLAAIQRDAASIDADATRVLVPESPTFVSDVATAGARFSAEPEFVLAADLSARQDPDHW